MILPNGVFRIMPHDFHIAHSLLEGAKNSGLSSRLFVKTGTTNTESVIEASNHCQGWPYLEQCEYILFIQQD